MRRRWPALTSIKMLEPPVDTRPASVEPGRTGAPPFGGFPACFRLSSRGHATSLGLACPATGPGTWLVGSPRGGARGAAAVANGRPRQLSFDLRGLGIHRPSTLKLSADTSATGPTLRTTTSRGSRIAVDAAPFGDFNAVP
ncbi:hypothetical protein [Streptomyces sviceus]|uniref:hypothetical protein n=1 Tax=Streptomyces sviceus TaxID=285530 RepID=UPI0036EA86EB